jgi:hypothetical protein
MTFLLRREFHISTLFSTYRRHFLVTLVERDSLNEGRTDISIYAQYGYRSHCLRYYFAAAAPFRYYCKIPASHSNTAVLIASSLELTLL